MSVLADFFKGCEKQMGIFAPRGYMVALFPDFPTAAKVERNLLAAGFREDEVVAVPGDDVILLMREEAQHSGLATMLMQELSRIFETEETYADHDFELASRGAGFLAAFTPNRSTKWKAWKFIELGNPIVARHYSFHGVEHLVGET